MWMPGSVPAGPLLTQHPAHSRGKQQVLGTLCPTQETWKKLPAPGFRRSALAIPAFWGVSQRRENHFLCFCFSRVTLPFKKNFKNLKQRKARLSNTIKALSLGCESILLYVYVCIWRKTSILVRKSIVLQLPFSILSKSVYWTSSLFLKNELSLYTS